MCAKKTRAGSAALEWHLPLFSCQDSKVRPNTAPPCSPPCCFAPPTEPRSLGGAAERLAFQEFPAPLGTFLKKPQKARARPPSCRPARRVEWPGPKRAKPAVCNSVHVCMYVCMYVFALFGPLIILAGPEFMARSARLPGTSLGEKDLWNVCEEMDHFLPHPWLKTTGNLCAA